MKKVPMVGRRFGRLTVIRAAPSTGGHKYWLCKCDCGNEAVVEGGNLRSGHTKTCGHCERYEYLDEKTMICRLANGQSFLFDADDYGIVRKHKWSIESSGYVHTTVNGKHIRLHNVLLKSDRLFVDHINGDGTDNRRCNLRLCSNKQNVRNGKMHSNNTSGYKGVSYDSRKGKFYARITVNYKEKFLGYFSNPREAAIVYDAAASFYFGEYARPNFGKENLYESLLEMGA